MSTRGRRLRRASALLLVAWLVGLGTILVQRELRRRPAVAPVKVSELANAGEGQPVRVQKGFVYNDVLGVEPNFRIAARETVEFASGWYELRDVDVALFRPGAASYGLVAGRARFNAAQKEAVAEQDVQLSLGNGIAVRGDRFTLHGTQRSLASDGGVTFAGPGWGGLGGELNVDLAADRVKLSRGVSISWRGTSGALVSLVILAPRMEYERQRALLHCPAGVTFLRGGMRMSAASADLRLDPDTGRLLRVVLDDPVRMSGALDDGGLVLGSAGTTEIQPLPAGRYRVSAGPSPATGWVDFLWTDTAGVQHAVRTWRLVGEGSETAWEWLEGQELVCASEAAERETLRDLSAKRLQVSFSAGRPATARATGDVRLDLENGWASGDELVYSLSARTFTLLPPPGGWVHAGSAGLEVACDRVEGQEGGVIRAAGQVHGTVEGQEAPDAAGPPTRFASDRATLGSSAVVLEGDARLWQVQRMVRADRLDYDRATDVVVGKGNVLTTGVTAGGTGGQEVRVRASTLRYDRPAGVAEYGGNVSLEDARSQTSCQQLSVVFASGGGINVATLEGGVVITERDTGRVVKGDRARLDAASNVVRIWGSPVVITELNGNQVSGAEVSWDRTANSVLVEGAEGSPSETLYKPEKDLKSPGATKPGKGRRPR